MKTLLFLACLCASLLAVRPNARAQAPDRICGFDSLQRAVFRRTPGAEQEYRRFLQQAAQLAARTSTTPATASRTQPDVTVPVVVHIIHNGGANNISDAQVLDALRIANEDYSKSNPDTLDVIPAFRSIHANIGFRFRLAQRDPNGNCTTGITRTFSSQTLVGDDNVKSLVRWDPTRYLNVWVCENANGAGGYAYLPCTGGSVDGIVVRNAQFGSIGTSANRSERARRTFTHELAHYFGVPHTWGSTNTAGLPGNCAIDDGIVDTPNTIGSSTTVCSLTDAPCGVLANVQNHMDYAQCTKMFTLGQRAVMRTSLNLSCRSTLVSAANLVATGTNDGYQSPVCPPTVAFSATTQLCAGSTASFSDATNLDPAATVQRVWSFPGGVPATSTAPNPVVTYPAAGVYEASLAVTTATGTATQSQRIQVLGDVAAGQVPLAESFEDPTFAAAGTTWQITATGGLPGTPSWERQTTATASNGSAYLVARNASIPTGQSSWLYSPALGVANLAGGAITVQFDYAYARRTGAASETLNLSFSPDCGASWSFPITLGAQDLNTQGTQLLASFAPVRAADWNTYSLTLPAGFAQAGPTFRARLQLISGGGNSVFLDNFRLTGTVTRAADPAQRGISVFPNPLTPDTGIRFMLTAATQVQLRVLDVLGRTVYSPAPATLGAGTHTLPLREAGTLHPGIYQVQLRLAEETYTTRLLVH